MYDGVEIDNLLMSDKEITSAFDRVPNTLIQSIENAIENVKTFLRENPVIAKEIEKKILENAGIVGKAMMEGETNTKNDKKE